MANWQLREDTKDAYQQITAYLAYKIREAAKAKGITGDIVVERNKSDMAQHDVRVVVTREAKDKGLVAVLNSIANGGLKDTLGKEAISPINDGTNFSKGRRNYFGISINGDPQEILSLIKKKDSLILASAVREAHANSLG